MCQNYYSFYSKEEFECIKRYYRNIIYLTIYFKLVAQSISSSVILGNTVIGSCMVSLCLCNDQLLTGSPNCIARHFLEVDLGAILNPRDAGAGNSLDRTLEHMAAIHNNFGEQVKAKTLNVGRN